jgi:hypothetical protein
MRRIIQYWLLIKGLDSMKLNSDYLGCLVKRLSFYLVLIPPSLTDTKFETPKPFGKSIHPIEWGEGINLYSDSVLNVPGD